MQFLAKLKTLGYWFFEISMKIAGYKGARVLLVPVIFCYVVFSGKIHKLVRPYLDHRFGAQSWLSRKKQAFAIMHSFGTVLMDRVWLARPGSKRFKADVVGYQTMVDITEQKKGMILLTAHVGNWQAAISHLYGLSVPVNAMMRKDGVTTELDSIPFTPIDVDAPFGGMIEATAALQKGEVVTIMGDRYIKGPHVSVPFFGEEVRIPTGAFVLSISTGAPIVVVFAAKTAPMEFEVKVYDVLKPRFTNRDDRDDVLRECAEKYVQLLEKYLIQYPFQWYNFYDFWKQ